MNGYNIDMKTMAYYFNKKGVFYHGNGTYACYVQPGVIAPNQALLCRKMYFCIKQNIFVPNECQMQYGKFVQCINAQMNQ